MRFDDGHGIPAIADQIGVSDVTIYRRLLAECPDEWKAAQAAKSLSDLERAEEELKTAADQAEVSRASARVRSAQWKLERVCSRIYGQQSTLTIEAGQSWGALLDQVQQRARPAIEAEDVQLLSDGGNSGGNSPPAAE